MAHLDVSGKWTIQQSNIGKPVEFDLRQDGAEVTGRATWFTREPGDFNHTAWDKPTHSMEARGRVTERNFHFAVSWQNGARGIYEGALLADGTLAGHTWDEMRPSNRASWHSSPGKQFRVRPMGRPITAMGKSRPNKASNASLGAVLEKGSPLAQKSTSGSKDLTERALKARKVPRIPDP